MGEIGIWSKKNRRSMEILGTKMLGIFRGIFHVVSINGGIQKCLVDFMENPIKMDENWGFPISGNHHIEC